MCDCFDNIDKALKPSGWQTAQAMSCSIVTGKSRTVILVPVERRVGVKSRAPKPIIYANHCPFCGQKWPELGESA
jgi:hypothetical protein